MGRPPGAVTPRPSSAAAPAQPLGSYQCTSYQSLVGGLPCRHQRTSYQRPAICREHRHQRLIGPPLPVRPLGTAATGGSRRASAVAGDGGGLSCPGGGRDSRGRVSCTSHSSRRALRGRPPEPSKPSKPSKPSGRCRPAGRGRCARRLRLFAAGVPASPAAARAGWRRGEPRGRWPGTRRRA